jgi:hypothetical protein
MLTSTINEYVYYKNYNEITQMCAYDAARLVDLCQMWETGGL